MSFAGPSVATNCFHLRVYNRSRLEVNNGMGRFLYGILLLIAAAIGSPAQTFTTLVRFDGTDGANPYYVTLRQNTDGRLYGTTSNGGRNAFGTVFSINLGGGLGVLHNFNFADGGAPTRDSWLPPTEAFMEPPRMAARASAPCSK
jgi:uncharacterized repeat protein (TIGR03803 family)